MEKINSKAGMWITFIVISFLVYKCLLPSQGIQQAEANQSEYQNDSLAIRLVLETQKDQRAKKSITAPYRGGVAVLSENSASYWVYKNIVYSVNGIASNWSPSISYAPPAIEHNDIIKAIEAYHRNGKINSKPISTKVDAEITKLIGFSSTTLANKKAYSFYLGSDDKNYCDVAVTADLITKNKGIIKSNENKNEFSVTCNWNGGYFILLDGDTTNVIFTMKPNKDGAEATFTLIGAFVENGKEGRILNVSTKNEIPFDGSKAIK
jgi:hypothetical protein